MDATSAHTHREPGLFETTRWSVVRAAAAGDDVRAQEAMTWLFKNYWHPLYTFMRGTGRSKEAAEDVVQEFFTQLLDGRLLTSVTPERGRFRTMMLASLRNLDTDFRLFRFVLRLPRFQDTRSFLLPLYGGSDPCPVAPYFFWRLWVIRIGISLFTFLILFALMQLV